LLQYRYEVKSGYSGTAQTEYPMITMAERIRELRLEKGYTLAYMATKMGHITPQGYRKFETGTVPSVERLVQICEIFGCSADFLLVRVDRPWLYLEESKLPAEDRALLDMWHAKRNQYRINAGEDYIDDNKPRGGIPTPPKDD
jgi:transcriptional regulator with XRE-family HTH domain